MSVGTLTLNVWAEATRTENKHGGFLTAISKAPAALPLMLFEYLYHVPLLLKKKHRCLPVYLVRLPCIYIERRDVQNVDDVC